MHPRRATFLVFIIGGVWLSCNLLFKPLIKGDGSLQQKAWYYRTLDLSAPPASFYELNRFYPPQTSVNTNSSVYYNRVPKCGSSTMLWTLKRLSSLNQFSFRSIDHHGIKTLYGGKPEESLAKILSKKQEHTLTVGQFPFVNFERFNESYPLYINVVREPIDRLVSAYYYRRFGFQRRNGTLNKFQKRLNYTDEERLMTVDECVLGKHDRCVQEGISTLTFFCGFEHWCRQRTSEALKKAKENVVKHFVTVGILEDMENTLKVLEALFPRYFKWIARIYYSSPEILGSRTTNRKTPSKQVQSILRKQLAYEVEFYEFLKERFYKQVHDLRTSGKIS